jgi:2-(1,2-epoxy-1,2-dihydrophenyl)acetyl-CoA isomerase
VSETTATRVRTERGGGVTTITLDGERVRNALDFSTWEELERAVSEAEGDEAIGAIVLTGAGGTFSSGGDLRTSSARGRGVRAVSARLRLAQQVLAHVRASAKPIIVAAEGATVGIAWGLVLACDLTVAADDAHFSAPFLNRGLVPDGGLGWLLPRLVGRQRATALLLLGERLPAAEAWRLGLVHSVVDPGASLGAATEIAGQLAGGPPDATALARELIRRGGDLSHADYLDEELLSSALHQSGGEPTEGRTAFLARRAPSFGRGAPAAGGASDG